MSDVIDKLTLSEQIDKGLLVLGYSPLTERVYLGKVNKKKRNEWSGKKRDVTSNFIQVLLQKFTPGTDCTITVNGKPKYSVQIKEI